MQKNRFPVQKFLHDHSLSLVAAASLGAWIALYGISDPDTHIGAFFGNAIADWTGTVLIVVGTKWLFEKGSAESRKVPRHLKSPVWDLLNRHSLTLFILVTGTGWLTLYVTLPPMDKWGQVVGNILSEWVQLLGIVLLTKGLIERGSKESSS